MISQSWVGQAIPGPWLTWTPTLSGRLNDSKWTKSCKYVQMGKKVICKLTLVANAATPMDGGSADALFTLPVTSAALSSATGNTIPLGTAHLIDVTGSYYGGSVFQNSTTIAGIFVYNASATYTTLSGITSAIPFTWASGDEIHATFVYEAA